MHDILVDLKLSLSKLRLKYETESLDDESYLCGFSTSFLSSAGGGVMNIGPLSYTYGRTNQAFLDGNYAGLQCTSMALAAIIYNSSHPKFTPKNINKILTEGNRLHSLLRDEIRLSEHPDGKVAVEEFPHLSYLALGEMFGRNTHVRLRQECQNVFTSKPEGFECFLSIKEYLEKWKLLAIKRIGFLISVRESSYAIILKRSGKVVLFDSHGHLKMDGEIIKEKAGSLKLPSVDRLESLLTGMYGAGAQAVIAPVTVSFQLKEYHTEIRTPRKLQELISEYKPVFLNTQWTKNKVGPEDSTISDSSSAEITDNEDGCDSKKADDIIKEFEASPYIGLMGSSF